MTLLGGGGGYGILARARGVSLFLFSVWWWGGVSGGSLCSFMSRAARRQPRHTPPLTYPSTASCRTPTPAVAAPHHHRPRRHHGVDQCRRALHQAQLASGDVIVKIGDQVVATWQDARWHLLKHAVERSTVAIEVHNERGDISWRNLNLSSLKPESLDGDFLHALGFARLQPPLAPVIGKLLPEGAGQRAGLLPGDEIVSIDGAAIARWDQLVTVVSSSPGKRLDLEIRRGGALRELTVTPDPVLEKSVSIGRIGATPQIDRAAMQKYMVEVRYGYWESLPKALERTWDTSAFSLQMLGKMLVGEVSLKNLSGPITIADYAGQSAQIGWVSYLVFLALISISLGVLNLLPIPLLDGGHLLYYMFEILKGSPLSERTMAISQQIGMGVLMVLMVFALYNDITRLVNG